MQALNSGPVLLDGVHTGVCVYCACDGFLPVPRSPCSAEVTIEHVSSHVLPAQA